MILQDIWIKFLLFLASCGCIQERKHKGPEPLRQERSHILPQLPLAEEIDWDCYESDSDLEYIPMAQEDDLFGIDADAARLMI